MKKNEWLFCSVLLVVWLVWGLAVWATESAVVSVGGGSGVTPGDVLTVTHVGNTPSAASLKVPVTVTGTLTTSAGDVSIATAGRGLKIEEGSVSARGTLCQVPLSDGSVLASNAAVTANTRVFLSRATGNTAQALLYSTNCVGLGVRVIGAETNTINVLMIEGQ